MMTGPAGVTAAAGSGVTLMVTGADDAGPQPLLVVTVYGPPPETVIDCVCTPVDHVYELAVELVSVAVVPEQMVTVPDGVTVGVGVAGAALIVTEAVPEHTPLATVTV